VTLKLDRPAFKAIFHKFVFLYEYQVTDEFYNQYSVQSYLKLYENKIRCFKSNSFVPGRRILLRAMK